MRGSPQGLTFRDKLVQKGTLDSQNESSYFATDGIHLAPEAFVWFVGNTRQDHGKRLTAHHSCVEPIPSQEMGEDVESIGISYRA